MQVKKQPLKSDMDQQTGSKLGKEYVKAAYCHSDGECSHKIKRHLLLGRKVMTNLDSVLKSRDNTWLTKVHPVEAMVFSSSYIWMLRVGP